MKIAILARRVDSWHYYQLSRAFQNRGVQVNRINYREITANVGFKPKFYLQNRLSLTDNYNALLVRYVGRGSAEEIVFRMDMLYRMNRDGLLIVNNPKSIEKAMDKYYTLFLLEEAGLPVPRTMVCENPQQALEAFSILGEKIVVKPIFGSRGRGMFLLEDKDLALRVFNTLHFLRHVIYMQEFIPHKGRDIRVFVIGEEAIAAMYRVSDSWKTNIALGAEPQPLKIDDELESLAVKAAKIIGCEIAGIDILESPSGYVITEVNSIPAWEGLQTVTSINIADRIAKYILDKLRR